MGAEPIKTSGVVLHQRNLSVGGRGSDRIVELLTADFGRIAVIARGARASRRRFAGALDLFVSLTATIVPRGNLWTLQAIDPHHMRLGIRESLRRFSRANILVDCCRTLCPEGLVAPDSLEALQQGLDALDRGDHQAALGSYGPLVRAAGICPAVTHCDHCRNPMSEICGVETQTGQLLCRACKPSGPFFHRNVARALRSWPVEELSADEHPQVEELAVLLVEIHQGRPLKSRLGDFALVR